MANISITLRCNLSCKYCFASGAHEQSSLADMSIDTFRQALAFLERSHIGEIRLLGGEPSIHPLFPFFIEEALKTNRPIHLFTNGILSGENLYVLKQIRQERIRITLNFTDFKLLGARTNKLVVECLTQLASKIVLGINIYQLNRSLDDIILIIDRYKLLRILRLGLAHPSIGTKHGDYLPPKEYAGVGRTIARFLRLAKMNRITVKFDCGFVPCMFQNGDIEILEERHFQTGLRCNPILDILPNGRIISCYPLHSQYSILLTDDLDAAKARLIFEQKLSELNSIGIYKHCTICEAKGAGTCTGGCAAHKFLRIRRP